MVKVGGKRKSQKALQNTGILRNFTKADQERCSVIRVRSRLRLKGYSKTYNSVVQPVGRPLI